MKKFFLAIAVFGILNCNSVLYSQSFNCADFSITAVTADSSVVDGYNVSILFSASSENFASYPYIAAVIDCNGDTVATGDMAFFGQLGQSTNEYPIVASGSFACGPLTAVFIYTNDVFATDTCQLTFSATAELSDSDQIEDKFSVYPIPFSDIVTISTNFNQVDNNYIVYDHAGKLILTGKLISNKTIIDLSHFSAGMYILKISENQNQTFKILKE